MISSLKKTKKNKALINQIISLVKEKGGLDYAIDTMNKFHKLAIDELETFEDSLYKDSLKNDKLRYSKKLLNFDIKKYHRKSF